MSTPDIDQALARVREFVTRSLASGVTASALAEEAGVDNKSVSLVLQPSWNPTASTLRKLEALIPEGWRPGMPVPAAPAPDEPARVA